MNFPPWTSPPSKMNLPPPSWNPSNMNLPSSIMNFPHEPLPPSTWTSPLQHEPLPRQYEPPPPTWPSPPPSWTSPHEPLPPLTWTSPPPSWTSTFNINQHPTKKRKSTHSQDYIWVWLITQSLTWRTGRHNSRNDCLSDKIFSEPWNVKKVLRNY